MLTYMCECVGHKSRKSAMTGENQRLYGRQTIEKMVMYGICNRQTEGRSDQENHLKSGDENLKTKYNDAYV